MLNIYINVEFSIYSLLTILVIKCEYSIHTIQPGNKMKRTITLSSILLISLFLFIHAVNAQPTPTPTPVLPEGYDWKFNPDNGHYYASVDQEMLWEDAYIFAQELGGYILTITDEQEQQWLMSTFSHTGALLGLQYDGKWKWITGESYSYNNWSPGEPSGDGSIVEITETGWNDRPDDHRKHFIIEFSDFAPSIPLTPTPTPEIWSSLNGETLADNYLTAGAPAGYTQGKIKLGDIPEGEGSDGIGMEIKLAPGQGVFISSFKEFEMPSLVHLSGSFRADNKEVAIALVGLNSPIDGQIAYTNVRGDEVPVNGYRKFNLIFAPPSRRMQYAIQAVNSPFSTISSTVWVDNIEVKSYEPIVDFEPVELAVDGNFEGGLEPLMVNINGDDGHVIPFFETITDIALRMSIEPSNIAANIGTTCQGIDDQFPFSLLGQVSVKRESMPGGGMMALVLTNGFQNLGIFRFADEITTINDVQDEMLIIGGDFTTNNPDIPISAFVQLGGPGADVSVVVDDLVIYKDGSPITQNPSSISPTNTPNNISTPTPTSTPTPDNPSELTVMLPDNIPLELVRIPAGTFMMGSPDDEIGRWEPNETQHQVTITKDFYFGKYAVTQAQYQAVMNVNPSYFQNKPSNPVEQVSWYDVVQFCNELSKKDGLTQVYDESSWTANWAANGYRLPTEAEWEYACRAGTTTRFYWGDDPSYTEINDYCWYGENNSLYGSQEVGQKIPNAYGLFDMSGNLHYWCHDRWQVQYTENVITDPGGPDSGRNRVYRGGHWGGIARYCRSASRHYGLPDIKSDKIGFRLLRTCP